MVPNLETDRLLLRPRTMKNIDDCVAMDSDVEVRRFITADFRDNFDPSKYRSALRERIGTSAGEGLGWWTLRLRNPNGAFVGMALLIPVALEGPEIEMGWRLPKAAWGKGYATEAARVILNYAIGDLALKEVIACINPDNVKSIRIARALGFELNGRKKAYGTEFDCYRFVSGTQSG